MASAAFNKFDVFVKDIAMKVHNLDADTFKLALTNTAPVAATDETFSDITEIAAGNGYTAGGFTLADNAVTEADGVAKIDITDFAITASGGAIATFRYLVVYNDTPTSPADPLCFYYDFGEAVDLTDTEALNVNFDGTNGVFTIT